jgi:phage terminase small subunit
MNKHTDVKKLAHDDYLNRMTYKQISEKRNIPINTLKSWKKRFKWEREGATVPKKVAQEKKRVQENHLGELIKKDLMNQLESNGIIGTHYSDLVSDYMDLWHIKNELIIDIKERGVVVEWNNGKQVGKKKNESISELNKTNAQMLKLLAELGLKATEFVKDDDDDDDV